MMTTWTFTVLANPARDCWLVRVPERDLNLYVQHTPEMRRRIEERSRRSAPNFNAQL